MEDLKIKFLDRKNENSIMLIKCDGFISFRINLGGNNNIDIELSRDTATVLKNILSSIIVYEN